MKIAIPERPRGTVRPTMLRREPGQSWYRITNQAPGAPGAEVWIYDEIGMWGVSAGQFVDEITALQVPELTVHINSPGGEVWDGLAIYNALRAHPARVMVRVDGAALSAASFIAQAGDRVITAAQSQWMIHEASGLCVGNADDMTAMAAVLDQMSGMIAEIYHDRARGGVAKWRSAMRAETWYTAAQAVEAGLADEAAVLPARQAEEAAAAMAAWDLSMFRRPAPAAPATAAAVPVAAAVAVAPAAARVEVEHAPAPTPAAARPQVPAPVPFDAEHFRAALSLAAGNVPAPAPARPRAFPVDSGAAAVPQHDAPAAPDLGQQLVALFRGALATAGRDVPAPAVPDRPRPAADSDSPPTAPIPEPEPAESPLAALIRAGITLAANNTPAPDQPAPALAAVTEPRIDHHRPAVFARAIKEAQL